LARGRKRDEKDIGLIYTPPCSKREKKGWILMSIKPIWSWREFSSGGRGGRGEARFRLDHPRREKRLHAIMRKVEILPKRAEKDQ